MLLVLSLLGCRCAPPGDAAPEIGHYAAMSEILGALVAGDLVAVKDQSRQLEGGAAAADPALAVWRDRLHGAVGFAIAATDLEDAAAAVAVMGRACAECHAAVGRPLSVAAPQPATGEPLLDHAAGAQAAWLGYLTGDDRALGDGLSIYAGAVGDQQAVRAAAAAAAASDPAERADAVARWLAGCPACHLRPLR